MSQYGKQIGQLFSPRLTYVEHMLQEKKFYVMHNYSIERSKCICIQINQIKIKYFDKNIPNKKISR